MLRGEQLSEQVYDPEHIKIVLKEIQDGFPKYFSTFKNPKKLFDDAIKAHQKEQPKYQNYLDLEALDEFESDPNSFKQETRRNCPIIRRCLMSQEEIMKTYQIKYSMVDGEELLHTIYNIGLFGEEYVDDFNHKQHEASKSCADLGLEKLSEGLYTSSNVVGYGIQSTLLYSLYPFAFAHRSQKAMWSLYFMSGRKDFGLGSKEGSEFLIAQPDYGTCEQNYFYPPELFGYYALKIYLMLKKADASFARFFDNEYRYIYLNVFFDHVADTHREDISILKRTFSDDADYWH
jgi:hypothetical protein